MKKNFLLAILAIVFTVWGCSDTKDKSNKEDDTEETGKTKKTSDDEESTSSDNESGTDVQSTPDGLVRAIFKAASSGDYSALSGICAEDADKDSQMICDVENQSEETKQMFKEEFSKGTVVGDAEISGEEASVKIKFGRDGAKDEKMNLVKKGNKWYLVSF